MKPTSAIPLMCEAWELRSGDVDVDACRRQGIPVLGTNEDAVEVDVFGYSGTLAVRLILEVGLEVRKCRIVVFGPDRFGPVICDALVRLDAIVTLGFAIAFAAVLKTVFAFWVIDVHFVIAIIINAVAALRLASRIEVAYSGTGCSF